MIATGDYLSAVATVAKIYNGDKLSVQSIGIECLICAHLGHLFSREAALAHLMRRRSHSRSSHFRERFSKLQQSARFKLGRAIYEHSRNPSSYRRVDLDNRKCPALLACLQSSMAYALTACSTGFIRATKLAAYKSAADAYPLC